MSDERPLERARYEREEYRKAVENHEDAVEREKQDEAEAQHEAEAAQAEYQKIADPGGKRETEEQKRAWEAAKTAQQAYLDAAKTRLATEQRLASADAELQQHLDETREIVATLDPDNTHQEIRDGFDLRTARYLFDRSFDSFDACTNDEKHRLIDNISENLVGDVRGNPGDIQSYFSPDFVRLTESVLKRNVLTSGSTALRDFLDPNNNYFGKWLEAFDAFRKKPNDASQQALLDSALEFMATSEYAVGDIINDAEQNRESQSGTPGPVNPTIAAELEALAVFVKRQMRFHVCEPSYATLIEHLELIPELPLSTWKDPTERKNLRDLAVGAVRSDNVLVMLKSPANTDRFGKAKSKIKISVAKANDAVVKLLKGLEKDPPDLEDLAKRVASVHDRFNECLALVKASDDEWAVTGLRHAIDAVVYAVDLRLQRTALERARQGQ